MDYRIPIEEFGEKIPWESVIQVCSKDFYDQGPVLFLVIITGSKILQIIKNESKLEKNNIEGIK